MTVQGREVFLFDAVRTPRGHGSEKGALASRRPIDLVKTLLDAMRARHDLDTEQVDDLLLGCVTQTKEQGANLARVAALYAGWGDHISGATVNRFCTSGLDAVHFAAMKVASGMDDLVAAGGVESMSRVPMMSDKGAWFADPDVAERTRFVHMGVSADLIATLRGYTREQTDAFAVESNRRAAQAYEEGRFARSLVSVKGDDGEVLLARDERPRADLTVEKLGKKPPDFARFGQPEGDERALERYPELKAIEHVHHAGSSPGMVDGASLLLVGTAEKGKELGLEPRARITGMANASVEPVIMLTAPAPAARKALDHAGRSIADVDCVEINESFSATVMAARDELELDDDKLNVNGGAIAMGHPLGATGGMLIGTLLDELERTDKKVGLVTMCGGAGVGAATVIER